MDIGRISSYKKAHNFLLEKQGINNYQGDNCEIKGSLRKSCIGNNVHIGKNSKLESTIVYDNAIIGENVVLSGCIIGENSKIGSFSSIKNSVLGDNEKLADNSNINERIVWTQPTPEGYPDKQIGNVIEQ